MDYKKLAMAIGVLSGVLIFGALGYHYVEDMTFFDALYMTIITISTVGFSEIKPLSVGGRMITIVLITVGISSGTYVIGMVLKFFIEGELLKVFGRRKLERKISNLKDHFIICGFGRIGKIICTELEADNIKFIVIEQDPDAIEDLEKARYFYIQADATTEEALLKSGIADARGIVTAVRSDANNVFITLTARGLRPDIYVMSRASDEKNEVKLKRAGANRVVSPYLIGGRRMAQVLKRPTVVDFIDIAMMSSHLGLMMEEARVRTKSPLVGKNLIESHLRRDYGVIIVAIKKSSGDMIFNPMPQQKLDEGDVIVVLGKKDDLARMKEVL